MPSLLTNAKHWLDRADEARAVAGQMSDPEAKRTMLGIADSYERMARFAAVRSAKLQAAASKCQP
jgi:hypothetical protein